MDFINIENFSDSTKVILTSIIIEFLTNHQNNIEFEEQIQLESNTHLKTQLYIIFDDSNLFNESVEFININNPRRKKFIQFIRKFFVENKQEKKKGGINFILRDPILKKKYSQFISSEETISKNYDILYDTIRYNEKNLRFIKTEFPKIIQEIFSKILIKLSNYNKISQSYNIENIKKSLSIIKIFHKLDDQDKKMYIKNRIADIDDEITNTLTNLSTEINNNIDNDFDITFLKPNDISILSNETTNADQIWRDLTKSDPSVKYDINPDIHFRQFVKLFDFLRKQTEIFQLNTQHINILIHNTEEYIKFLNEEKDILSNIQYYSYNKKKDEVKDLLNFLNYLKKIPESDKNLLNKIISINSLPIKRLFDRINLNYNTGIIKCQKDCNQQTNPNIVNIKYYDENTKKTYISYNVLLIYLNKCRNILGYKKQRYLSNNLLPIGINLNDNYKIEHKTYAYICNNILEYYVTKNIINLENDSGNTYIVQMAYYKEFANIRNILKDYSEYYQNFDKTLSSKDFTKFIKNLIKLQLNYTNKHILDTKSEVINIISNIEDDKTIMKQSSLINKLEKKELRLYYDEYLKNCKSNHYQKLQKKYINKNTNITTFIKTIDNKLVKKLLLDENKKNPQNIEWNIMMSKNRNVFIAYFSNLFENVLHYFGNEDKKNIYSFEIFNSNNINHTVSLTDSEYITRYEQNFDKWITSVKYLLPIKNYIERYIQLFDKYLTYNLFKVINNRIILLDTSDEIKFYNNLQTSNDKENFTHLVLEKQNIIETLLTIHSNSKLFVMQQNFYDTLFNISFTNETLTKPIEDYINKIKKQIDYTTDYVSSLEILSEYMQDFEEEKITRQIKYKTEYINNLQKMITTTKILDGKYKTIDYDIEDLDYNNDEQNIDDNEQDDNKDGDEDEDNYEGDGEYGETNEPDEYDDSLITNSNYAEMDDFEQQSQINFEDIINLQQYSKFNNIKRWINTVYTYLNMDENKYISTQVITISENYEYKKTMNKNIHNAFAKYLKHPFLNTASYGKVLQLRYDKELMKIYRHFFTQIEFDVLKIISILYIIVYDLEQISQKKNITNSKTLLNFINNSNLDDEEDVISNFVKIIDGRWKGYVGTITTKYDDKKFVEGKKNIISNLNSTYGLYKRMKKNFKKEKIDLKKKSSTETHILETKKIIHHNEIITQKKEEFLNNIDEKIDNIKKIIRKNIDELKNKKIYITIDRYGIKDTKYIPHIKPISILKKNVKFSNINTKQVSNSLTNKFEEIKENFTNKKTLFDLTKSLFYVLEIFHPFTENKVEFGEIFEKNYLIYIYNFAFNIFEKNRVLHKRKLLVELNEEYNIDHLTKQLDNPSLLSRRKKQLQTRIKQAQIKQKMYEIEEKYSDIFETNVIKKVRKEDITSFANLYVNSKGNLLAEYKINAIKSVEIREKEKEKILIEDINSQFNQFEDIINKAYKNKECDLINLLNV
jgi:hypothetical protein